MDSIRLKAPATIANLSCGFDILGLCIDNPYDLIQINKIEEKTTKLIGSIICFLPRKKNTCLHCYNYHNS